MKMKYFMLKLLFLILISSNILRGQDSKNNLCDKFIPPDILITGIEPAILQRFISINYRLKANGPRKHQQSLRRYHISVFLSKDGGLTFRDTLSYLAKDKAALTVGKDLQVIWPYIREMQLTGKESLTFKLRVYLDTLSEKKRLGALGGPESAYKSMILPGWGHSDLNRLPQNWIKDNFIKPKSRWWIGAIAYGVLGTGIYMKLRSNHNYQQYQEANSLDEVNNFFSTADRQERLANYLIPIGIGIWAGDVLYTLIRGIKNKKRKRRLGLY